jgi:hypothetical protein
MDHKYDANGPSIYFYSYDQQLSRTTHRLQSRLLPHLLLGLTLLNRRKFLEATVVS